MDAKTVIELLQLEPLAGEGGFFKETFKAKGEIPAACLPGYSGERAYSTVIYYLITAESFSAFHRVRSDEIWTFHLGDPADMVQIHPTGALTQVTLGANIELGHHLHTVVPGGSWQSTKVAPKGKWSLFSAIVAPGFEYADTELIDSDTLGERFPQHKKLIAQYAGVS